MGFLRNIAGVLVVLPLAYFISTATDLQESAAVAILVQWVVAVLYAVPKQDETFFDLTGAVTHAGVSLLAFARASDKSWRKAMLTAMVWFWCVRLGSFLYLRIRKAGEDTRFVGIRENPVRFFSVWTVQGLWVFLTQIPVLLSLRHSVSSDDVHVLDIAGAALWALGYLVEVLADHQKTKFRDDPRNKGKFIQEGLWYYSRHPNYFGEISMWIGIFLITVHGMPTTFLKLMAAFGPAFVTLLLLKVSGVPLLEKQADERWGKLESYQKYKRETSSLIPLPKKA
jgi:steroid 5-alpha reductase family enzyme